MACRIRAMAFAASFALSLVAGGEERPRIRDLGVKPGVLAPGPENAITDVAGVRVGHRTLAEGPPHPPGATAVRVGPRTLLEGDSIRTGVTAVVPHAGNLFQQKVPAAVHTGNGFGKAAGFLQVEELGNLETPIILTNTLAVGAAIDAVVGWTLARPGNEAVRSVNTVVGETNDGWILNNIRKRRVRQEDVVAAIESAKTGPVE